ncbi:MAG: NAD-dependent epimerase/dehydratase family protein [Gammaproteobacteria bacterium]|nr:NAD-dependent epimerase/dehydratase family protein [Gammaproteobacteria bacterium]
MPLTDNAAGTVVAVTGGAGFIGSHTVDRLLTAGARVIVIDDFSTGSRDNLAQWQHEPRLRVIEAGVADGVFAPLAASYFGPVTHVIHLAAQTSVVYSVDNPLADIRVNLGGTAHVLEYSRYNGVRKVVFASSSAVYSDDVPFPTAEDAPCAPLSPYGVNKLASESLLRYYGMLHGQRWTALRFFNVYGPRQDPGSPYSGVISIFADRAAADRPLSIYGDGEQTRDFVYVGDVARALVQSCFDDRSDGAVINIGTGAEGTINELARLIIALSDSRSTVGHAPPRPGENRRSVADVRRARDLLGFVADTGLEDGLAHTLAWTASANPRRR